MTQAFEVRRRRPLLKWALYLGLGLIGLIAIAFVVGTMLPKAHEAWSSTSYRAKPEQVWAVVTDFAKYPEWRTGVTRVDVTGGGTSPLVTEHGSNGVIPFKVELMQAPSKMVMRIADPDLGFGGTWTFDLAPQDAGSELLITENGEIYNPLFRVMSKLFFSPTATIETYLDDLRKRLGEK
jgi:hypothetical protein